MDNVKEKKVRRLVEKIYPNFNERKIALEVFSACISEANRHGREKWAIHVKLKDKPKRIRLLVGHFVVCTLIEGKVWMSLDKNMLSIYDPSNTSNWEWDKEEPPNSEFRQIDAKNGYYLLDPGQHESIWPQLKDLLFSAMTQAAEGRKMDPRTPKHHAPSALRYIRNELHQHIPDPLFD